MTQQNDRRIFVYTPREDTGTGDRSPWVAESVRAWCFSPVGMVCAWLLVLGLVLPLIVFLLITLHEDYVLLILGFGLWLVFGLGVIHWWVPAARKKNARTEGIAAAGWHIALSVAAIGVAGWLLVFPDGLHSAYTLADIRPLIPVGAFIILFFGGLSIWIRGHTLGRTLRYGVVATSFTAVWMSLWLVAAHSGL